MWKFIVGVVHYFLRSRLEYMYYINCPFRLDSY